VAFRQAARGQFPDKGQGVDGCQVLFCFRPQLRGETPLGRRPLQVVEVVDRPTSRTHVQLRGCLQGSRQPGLYFPEGRLPVPQPRLDRGHGR
jgi:hypothetical protein